MLEREANSGWVFGLLERGTNKIRLFEVERRDMDTLLPIIADNCAPGSVIISDGWKAYGGIATLDHTFRHRWVNHRVSFISPTDPQVHTQSIEASWGALKSDMRHLHGTNPTLFPTYLFNYMFRRFYNREKIMQHLLEAIRRQYPL